MNTTVFPIETLPCRISSMRYLSVIARDFFARWWSVALLLVIGLIVATCYDLRFGIVLLMLIFMVLPLILFFVYFNYVLRPEAHFSIVEKSLIIDNDGIDCICHEKRREILKWCNVKRIVIKSDAFYIYIENQSYFYLPRVAFPDESTLHYFEHNFLRRLFS